VFASFNDTMVQSYVLPEYGHWGKAVNGTVMQYPDYTDLRFPKVGTSNPKVDIWIVDLSNVDSQDTGMVTDHTKIHPPISLTSNGEEVHFSGIVWADPDHFAVTWMNRVQVRYSSSVYRYYSLFHKITLLTKLISCYI
jgi:hypothetical protein